MRDPATWIPVDDDECHHASSTIEFLGRRWTSGVMLALGRGASRFSEIEAVVTGISARMLTLRLKELEQHGLIDRVVTPTTPVSVTYHLSQRGRELLSAMHALSAYGAKWERTPPDRA
jgi:DNA-binding HxlR family transcriptional regulator